MSASKYQEIYDTELIRFFLNNRKRQLQHPKSKNVHVTKSGEISHRKYGNPVQLNRQGIPVVYCRSQNRLWDSIEVSALRFVAECVLGRELILDVRVVPKDANALNYDYANVSFVDLDAPDEDGADCRGLSSAGELWGSNGFKPLA